MLLWPSVIKFFKVQPSAKGSELFRKVFAEFGNWKELLGCWFFCFQHFPAELSFGKFQKGNVSKTKTCCLANQWTRRSAASHPVQLSDPPGDEVHQHVGVADLFQCFLS